MPRVLIADDEDSMRTLVARAIAMDGHETVTAEDGAEALDILTREQGAFDLLLTDITREDGLGRALLEVARAIAPSLPILVITGLTSGPELAALHALGAPVLAKPFRPDELDAAARAAVAGRHE